MQRVELGEDGVLGARVDHERAVAALAAVARLDGALGACAGARRASRAGRRRRRGRRRASPRRAPYRWAASAAYPCRVPAAPRRPLPAQRTAAAHAGGPLLIVGGAGTRQDAHARRALRVARRAGRGARGDPRCWRAPSAPPTRCARQVEEAIDAPLRGARRHDRPRPLRAAAARARRWRPGVDPFAVAVGRADRLAMLLERIDELTLRSHDFRGNPAALIASFVRRIDRLKDELISADDYAALGGGAGGARRRRRDARARGARARVRRDLPRARPHARARRARSTAATS